MTNKALDQNQIRKLTYFIDMARFTLRSKINIQHNINWCHENVHTFQEIPLRSHKVRVWWAVNVRKIILIFFTKKHTLTLKFM
jgi:hypothetical protein